MSTENNYSILWEMLTEFEKQIHFLYRNYHENKISFEKTLNEIDSMKIVWNYARIDIKNQGTENNKIIYLEYEKNMKITFPKWFKNHTGVGSQLEFKKNENTIIFQCVHDGNLEIIFRALDFRNYNKNRVPVYINLTESILNNEKIIDQNKLVWHDKPFVYKIKSYDGQIFKLKVNFKSIYYFFPLLEYYLNRFNSKKNFEENFQKIINYIEDEKFIIQFRTLLNNVCVDNKQEFYDSLLSNIKKIS